MTGTGATIVISNSTGAQLDLGGRNLTIGALSGGGATGGNVVLGAGTLNTGGLNTSGTYGGAIGGSGALVKVGTGTMTMTGANTYSGATTISAGALEIGGSGVLNSGAYAGTITNTTSFIYSSSANQTLSGAIGGPGNITKSGAGTLTLTGVNTYTGTTTITTGTLVAGSQAGYLAPIGSRVGNAVTIGSGATLSTNVAHQFGWNTANTADVTINSGGTLATNNNDQYVGNLVLNGSAAIPAATSYIALRGNLTASPSAGAFATVGTMLSLQGAADDPSGFNAGVHTFTVNDDGTSATDLTIATAVYGAGNLTKAGAGTLLLSGSNSWTGGATLAAGVLSLGSVNALGTTGTISFTGGTLQYTGSNTADYSGRFSTAASQAFSIDTNGQAVTFGTGLTSSGATLTKLGSGTLTLTGSSTSSGNTTIAAGVLRLGNGGSAGSVAGNVSVASGASLAVNRSDAFTLSNAISGSGGLVQAGSGTTTLSAANSYSGATTITGGVLAVSNDSNLGTAPGSATPGSIVVNGGSLSFTSGFTLPSNRGIALGPTVGSGSGTIDVASGQTLIYGGVLANNGGTGGLVKAGAGTLQLSGAATYTGNTSVDAGTLQVGTGASLASPLVTVASGATLSGRGTVNATTVAAGGILYPGVAGSGTLTTGSLTFAGSATVTMGVSGVLPTNLLNVVGDVTTLGTGTSVVFAFGNNLSLINTGTYSLLTYSGTLSDASAFGYTGTKGGRQSVAVSGTTVSNAVSLVIGNSFPLWTGTNGNDWFASDNWKLNTDNAPTNFQNNDTVDFNDGATLATGTVVISGSNATPASVTFSANTKTYTLEATGGFGISTGAVVKSGSALVTITNANTYDGGTTLSLGRLRVGDNAALGSGTISFFGPAALSSDSGAARTLANGVHIDDDVTLGDPTDNGNLTLSGTITFDGNTHTLTIPSTVTLSGLVSNGGLTKSGTGILAITGSNSYGAGTALSAGTLQVGNDAALGSGGVTLADGVTLSSNSGSPRALTNQFTINGNVTLGDATKTGALTLGSVGGVNLGAATRQVTTASDVTFAGAVTNGGLAKLGAGTLTLSAANSYGAGTTLSLGTIVLGNVGALGSGTLTVAGNTVLRTSLTGTIANAVVLNPSVTGTFDAPSGNATWSGVFSGSGPLVKSGAATVTLSGTSTYSGDTTILAGALEIGGGGLLGSGSYAGAITNSGTLAVTTSANQTLAGAVSGVGVLTKSGAGTLTLSNASNSFSGGSTITGGVLAFTNGALGTSGNVTVSGGTLRWATGNTQDISSRLALVNSTTATLDTNGNNVTLAGGFGGSTSGGLTKVGAGTLSITGTTTYTGATTISAGVLDITGAGLLGNGSYAAAITNSSTLSITTSAAQTLSGAIANTGTVVINSAGNQTISGSISGSGAVTQAGAGTLTLSGNNSFSGQLTVSQGTLSIASINNTSANGVLGNSAAAVILGSSGNVGTLAYTGATASSSKRFTLATGGTGGFEVASGVMLTVSGTIGGSGGLVKSGAGTLLLSGSNTYAGNTVVNSGTIVGSGDLGSNSSYAPAFGSGNITVNNALITGTTERAVVGGWNSTRALTLNSGTWNINYAFPGLYNGGEYAYALTLNSGLVTTSNGAWFRAPYGGLSITSLASSGTSVVAAGFDLTFSNLTLDVADGAAAVDLALNGVITENTGAGSGARSVTKGGAGTVLFGAASTYTGNTTVNAGVLKVSGAGQLYSNAYNSSAVVTVNTGATLELDSFGYDTLGGLGKLRDYGNARVLAGGTINIVGTTQSTGNDFNVTNGSSGVFNMTTAGQTLTLSSNGNTNIAVGGALTFGGAGNITVNEIIENNTGAGSIIKAGLGTLTFGTSMTYTGSTTINSGTFVLTGAGQLGGGSYAGAFTNNAAFVSSASANQTLSGVVSGAGSFSKSGAGVLTLSNGGNSFTGGVDLSAGVLSFANGALGPSGTVTMNGGTLRWQSGNTQDVSSRLAFVNSTAATFDTNGNDVTLGTGLGGGSTASLVKTGFGTLSLTGSNDFTGGSTISTGALEFVSGGLGSSGTVTVGDATLKWATGNTQDISSRLALTNATTATLDVGSNNVTLAAGFGVGSSGGLTKSGVGTLTLSASNGYSGATTVTAGTLALVGSGNLTSSSGVDVNSGAVFDIANASSLVNIGTLIGSGSVALGGNTLRSTVGNESLEFNGVMGGSGGFTKAGSGTFALTSIQDFTGTARVDAGILAIGGTNTLAAASRIFVASGATLDATAAGIDLVSGQTLGGYGTITGNVNFLAGSTLSPGGSVGSETASSATWNSGFTYLFEVNNASGTAGMTAGGWDLFTVTGTLTLAGSLINPITIDLTSLAGSAPGLAADFDPSFNYAWKFAVAGAPITTFDSTWFTVSSGSFQNLSNNPERFYVARGDQLPAGYPAGTSSELFVVYAAVPEPGTLALAGIGLAAAGWTAYRRRRRTARSMG